ncbi:MAG: hypothetical protein K1X51_18135 [Rhodospirillaceae bacterium]|nr:hypothetical protein [Rhodospirillaceae bacterium]
MTVRVLLPVALTMALATAGCSKHEEATHEEAKQAPAPAEPAGPAAAAPIRESAPPPVDTTQQHRESELELRAQAAEARARMAEIELQERTRRELERQQLAAQAEAARAALLAEQARVLDAENAALRARALENEQRAIEAERAAYGAFGNGTNVIIVQPPQRPRPRPPQNQPPQNEPPPKGAGISVGLNRPAIPDLTPPGAPATFGGPKFDTMRARKPREASDDTPPR